MDGFSLRTGVVELKLHDIIISLDNIMTPVGQNGLYELPLAFCSRARSLYSLALSYQLYLIDIHST